MLRIRIAYFIAYSRISHTTHILAIRSTLNARDNEISQFHNNHHQALNQKINMSDRAKRKTETYYNQLINKTDSFRRRRIASVDVIVCAICIQIVYIIITYYDYYYYYYYVMHS